MSGDYSRIRFDPSKDITSVWMQQGRVQLDSDWNEGMAALDRRLRAESVDTFGVHPVPGRTGVAVVSPQTADAFRIDTNDGRITIGQGRMYVDGLLVENHGGGEEVFDPVLAELRGQSPLDYYQQPYFLEPSPPPEGPYLAYLEVWQRELTHLQHPEMVENAVGVDTTTRWQTVWQVRFLALGERGNVDCNTRDEDLPSEWQVLTRPSAGRMSIKAEVAPPDTGPCELPPSGGYRGLENQLYRIEIHDGGAVGTATFKWSRDNASVASAVVEIVSQTESSTKLKLASLGRDTVSRFNTGDWVEILDDRRELDGENSNPALRRGAMRQITVDNDMQTIEFSPALPADLIPAGGNDTLAARHTRVRRWDQKGTAVDSATGLIEVPPAGVWMELEKGIRVQFSLAADEGEFRCGDYWVSAARTADTSIETFTDAPPRGIHRHYARLAIVDLRDNERFISDCRIHWPPACSGCCTITVAPGESIQDALNALPEEGGCVCLKAGVHIINEPIRINRSNVILQGESHGAIVRSNGTALKIEGNKVDSVVVQRIRFEVEKPRSTFYLLEAQNCARLRVTDCEFIVEESSVERQVEGLHFQGVVDAVIANNHIRNMRGGITITGDTSRRIDIRDNFLEGGGASNTTLKLTTAKIADEVLSERGRTGSGIRISSRETSREISIRSNRLMKFYVSISMDASEADDSAPPKLGTSGVIVDENLITQCVYGVVGIGGKRNRIRGNHIDTTYLLGIGLFKESDSEVNGNHLYSCRCGIFLNELNGAVALLNNRLMNCGLSPLVNDRCFSIYVDNEAGEKNEPPNNAAFRIDGCEIIDTGVVDAEVGKFVDGPVCGIYIRGLFTALQITNNRIDCAVTNPELNKVEQKEHRALLFHVGLLSSSGVLIANNQFRGYGYSALVEAGFLNLAPIPCIAFSNNVCDHLNSEDNGEGATVILNGAKMSNYFIVMGNQITSHKKNSLSLGGGGGENIKGGAICIGNTMTGDIDANTALLKITPTSYRDFNIIGG